MFGLRDTTLQLLIDMSTAIGLVIASAEPDTGSMK